MVYTNGLRYDGTWSEGTKVHGKTTRGKSKSSSSSGGGKSKSVRRSPEIGGAGQEKENDGGSGTDAGGVATSTNARPTLKEYRDLYKSAGTVPDDVEKQTVKNMKFIDFYGDPGRYTGEVNDQKMPHGMGQMTYDHGLVQEGNWVSCHSRSIYDFSSCHVTTTEPNDTVKSYVFTNCHSDKWNPRRRFYHINAQE